MLPSELGWIWGGIYSHGCSQQHFDLLRGCKRVEDPLPCQNLLVLIKKAVKIMCRSHESVLAGHQSTSMGISEG